MRMEPLEPRRVRYPRGAYGWVDLKIVTEGWLQSLGSEAALTYLFLCAVGNCQGMSFWSKGRMARTLGIDLECVEMALQKLEKENLIAANGCVIQVLALSSATGSTPDPTSSGASSTSRVPSRATEASRPLEGSTAEVPVDEDEIRMREPEARAQLVELLGKRSPSAAVVRALAKSLAQQARRSAGAQAPEGPDDLRG